MSVDKNTNSTKGDIKQNPTVISSNLENFSASPDICKKLTKHEGFKDDDDMFSSDYMLQDSEILDFSEGADS